MREKGRFIRSQPYRGSDLYPGKRSTAPRPLPAEAVTVGLQQGTASCSQYDSSPDEAIDGNITSGSDNGWAILCNPGPATIAQTAVWETAADITGLNQLTIKLYQVFGGCENIGRFRLSATSDARANFADGLDNGGDVTASWTVLDPSSNVSANGATLTEQGDHSILASGTCPAQDVYTIVATETVAGPIRGIRLEVLEDASLPNSGPGRSANGNFILSEIQLDVVPLTTLEVKKVLVPFSNNGRFNIGYDGAINDDTELNARNGSTTGTDVQVTPGVYTIFETFVAGTNPQLYDTTIHCTDGTNSFGSLTTVIPPVAGTVSLAGVNVQAGDHMICTITNTFIVPTACNALQPFDQIIRGTAASEILNGTSGKDLILGNAGFDTINGLGGNDCLVGGSGDDEIRGDAGNDVIVGGEDDDDLQGGIGNDTIHGNEGNDKLYGDSDASATDTDGSFDVARGLNGTDTCVANSESSCEL